MPWKETTTMEQKVEFICEWISEKYTISELCRFFGISRPTAYNLISRYEENGIKGLLEHSKAPINHPNRTKEEIEKEIQLFKGKHDKWGAKKIKILLREEAALNNIFAGRLEKCHDIRIPTKRHRCPFP